MRVIASLLDQCMPVSITALVNRVRGASRQERELWLAGAALAFGLLVLPFLIYLAGSISLGPYESGSVWLYLFDFLKGLVRPHLAYWLIVVGPYLLILLLRGLLGLRRRVRQGPAA
jgi:hypothetical protein